MTTPLGTLLSESLTFWKNHLMVILIGSVFFALAMSVGQMYLISGVESGVSSIMNEMGMDANYMDELGKRIEEGDQDALEEMMANFGEVAGSMDAMDDEEVEAMMQRGMMGMIREMMPSLGTMAIIGILVSLIASAYFLVIAVKDVKAAGVAAAQVPGLVLPLLGLWVWIFLRTFVWIPVVGIIFAIILGPRFLCAPIILVKEKKGVFESASLSYSRTTGYWGKIFGNMIVMALSVMIASMVIGFVIGIFSAVIGSRGVLVLGQLVQQLTAAYAAIFAVQLANTVMENPMKVMSK